MTVGPERIIKSYPFGFPLLLFEPRHNKTSKMAVRTGRFESYLVGNPEGRFSREVAHMRNF